MAVAPVTLTWDQIASYEESGYLIVPGVFDDDTCERIKAEAAGLADPRDAHVLLNLHRSKKFFLNLARHPVLVGIVVAVQRSRVVVLNDQFIFKWPGTTYAKQAWTPHQDIAYIDAPHGTYVQLHVFLSQSDRESGGLYYYPGSHREPILQYVYRPSWREPVDADGITRPGRTIQNIPSQYPRVDVVVPKGGICLQHGNVIHGSYPNLSRDRGRETYAIAYLNEGAPFQSGETSLKIRVPVDP